MKRQMTRNQSDGIPAKPTVRATLETVSSLFGKDWFDSRPPDVDAAYYGPEQRPGIAPCCSLWRADLGLGASVVLVHGGGFVIGHRQMKAMRLLATRLSALGFHVCSVDYRMLFRGGRLNEAVDDVAQAIKWWSNDPVGWRVDPSRLAVVALSAGSALTLLAAGRQDVHVARIAAIFGIFDFRALHGRVSALIARKLVGSHQADDLLDASPISRPQPSSPVLLIHGSNDNVVPAEQSYALQRVRQAAGLRTSVSVYDGAPHAFLNQPGPFAQRALDELTAFLRPLVSEGSALEDAN